MGIGIAKQVVDRLCHRLLRRCRLRRGRLGRSGGIARGFFGSEIFHFGSKGTQFVQYVFVGRVGSAALDVPQIVMLAATMYTEARSANEMMERRIAGRPFHVAGEVNSHSPNRLYLRFFVPHNQAFFELRIT